MSIYPEIILERALSHLRTARRVALETDDAIAYYAVVDAAHTVNDALKAVKSEQEHASREQKKQVRTLALVNPTYKRRVRVANPQFLRAA